MLFWGGGGYVGSSCAEDYYQPKGISNEFHEAKNKMSCNKTNQTSIYPPFIYTAYLLGGTGMLVPTPAKFE